MGMAVLHSPEEFCERYGTAPGRSTLTVGNFDGVHLGHQKILRGVVERARGTNTIGIAVTFDPHPLRVLRPGEAPALLIPLEERLARFEELGLDTALVVRFDESLSQLGPEEFVRGILVDCLRAGAVLVGENFRFGHRQAGDARRLEELGKQMGFAVECIKPVVLRGEVVSSTVIRQAVREGRVIRAGRFLGHPFALRGEIHPGTGQGRRLVVPTLNLSTSQEMLPKIGVYATETIVAGRRYRSATNVGVRPTFDGVRLTTESHLLDFSAELTSGPIEVHFWKRLRDEMKFPGPDPLRAQVLKDVARAHAFFRRLDRFRHTRQPA